MKRLPFTILIATIFVVICAVALTAFGITFVLAGSQHGINDTIIQKRGDLNIIELIVFGVVMLLYGVYRLLKKQQASFLFVILGIPLAIGCVGQTIDMFGTASARSDLIGLGILLLFAIPIVLLLLPSSKQWLTVESRPTMMRSKK